MPNTVVISDPSLRAARWGGPIGPPPPRGRAPSLLLHQGAIPLIDRPERLGGGDGGAQLVVVPRRLGLRRLLHLEEVHVVDLAAVRPDRTLPEQRVVGRRLLHLCDHLGPVVRFERVHRLQVVRDRRVHAGVDHGRMDAAVPLGELLPPGARLVVHVPVERLREDQPLRRGQAEPVHVGEEDEQAGEVLAALHDPELRRLLDGIGRVAARVGEPDDLGLRRLGLQQERREVRGIERMAHLAEDLAAVLQHHRLGVALERMTERVVGGQKEPAIPARLHDGIAGPVCERPGVVGPVDGIGRARLARQVRGRRARHQEGLALVPRDLVHREGHGRVRHVGDDVHLVRVVPLPRDIRSDVGLVLMVGEDDLDLHALGRRAKIFHRHPRRHHRALSGEVRVEARLVVQHTDLDDPVGDLRLRGPRGLQQGEGSDHTAKELHGWCSFPGG